MADWSEEQLELVRRAEGDPQVFFLEVDAWKVLFRIDGLIVTVSPVVFDLFSTYLQLDIAWRLEHLSDIYGPEEVEAAVESLQAIFTAGILGQGIPDLESPAVEATQPSGILLMVTQTCNLACVYCYAGGGTYGARTKLLGTEKAFSAIDLMLARAPARKAFTVTFFGGEPLLDFPLIRRVVEHCRESAAERGLSFSYSMTTNATVVTDEIIAFLKEHRFTLMVSYDGEAAQEQNRPFKSGKGSNEEVLANIRRMTAAGLPVQLRATLIKGMISQESIQGLVQIGSSLGARKLAMSAVSSTKNSLFPAGDEMVLGHEDHQHLQRIYQQVSEENLASACRGSEERVRFDPHAHLVKALATGQAEGIGRCGACFGMSAVSTDGKIYPCHRFVGMEEYAIGELATGFSRESIEQFFARSRRANHEKCSTCWVRLICTGGCYYHNADGAGDFRPPEDADCDGYREAVRYAIGQLLRLRSLPPEQAERFMRNTPSSAC
jgi:uncharacterized protein